MNTYIPYGKQSIEQSDIDEVIRILKSPWITQGPAISAFETALSAYTQTKYAVAVSSATAALHLACLALQLGPGDYLWTSPNTFVASANCGLYCGAQVDFVDIDPTTYNLDADQLELKLQAAAHSNKLPKIVIPVHFAGQACDMEKIAALAKKYNFHVIEDASHAIGGSYQQSPIGNCRYSDMTIFSFHPVKIITTGEGGLILTNNSDLNEKLQRLRTHGITRNHEHMKKLDGPWYYEQIELGYNYRMTDIQAALGLNQLKRLTEFTKRRHDLAMRYHDLLANLPLTTPKLLKDRQSAWHLYVILLQLEHLSKSRLEVFNALREKNIGVNVHYIPVYKQPYYAAHGFGKMHLTNMEYYYERAITLPLYPSLTTSEQDRVVDAVRKALA